MWKNKCLNFLQLCQSSIALVQAALGLFSSLLRPPTPHFQDCASTAGGSSKWKNNLFDRSEYIDCRLAQYNFCKKCGDPLGFRPTTWNPLAWYEYLCPICAWGRDLADD